MGACLGVRDGHSIQTLVQQLATEWMSELEVKFGFHEI